MTNRDREGEGWIFLTEMTTDTSGCSSKSREGDETGTSAREDNETVTHNVVNRTRTTVITDHSSVNSCQVWVDGADDPLQQTMDCNPRVSQSRLLFSTEDKIWQNDSHYTGTRTLTSPSWSCQTRAGIQEINPRDALPRNVDSLLNPSVLCPLFPHISEEQIQTGVDHGTEYQEQAYIGNVAGYSMARNYDEFQNEARSQQTDLNSTRLRGSSTVRKPRGNSQLRRFDNNE